MTPPSPLNRPSFMNVPFKHKYPFPISQNFQKCIYIVTYTVLNLMNEDKGHPFYSSIHYLNHEIGKSIKYKT